jgi:hypothetical protein
MIAMALALAALALEIWRGSISVSFGRRVAELALGAFTVLVFWNSQAWILNKNIDRARETGKFDAHYATVGMSRDAIPTLVNRRAEIPLPQRDTVEADLACDRLPGPRRWFEWNRSVSAADKALRSWNRPPCPEARDFERRTVGYGN